MYIKSQQNFNRSQKTSSSQFTVDIAAHQVLLPLSTYMVLCRKLLKLKVILQII